MKQPIFALILIILASLAGCRPKPASQPAGDTLATRQGAETTTPAQLSDTAFFPDQTGYVNDFGRLFTNAQINSLDSLVRDYERKTTTEIVIVTLDSVHANHQNFEDYTLEMANRWGVGKEEKNNGILIAISPALRRIRIQNGYGIEKIITNEETKAIIDSVIIPQFRKNDYYQGTREGIIAIMARLDAKS